MGSYKWIKEATATVEPETMALLLVLTKLLYEDSDEEVVVVGIGDGDGSVVREANTTMLLQASLNVKTEKPILF